jgi:hypothetical protein
LKDWKLFIQKLDKADKEFNGAKELPRLRDEEMMKRFKYCIHRDMDVSKTTASLILLFEHRINHDNKNNDVEYAVSQTLKQLEEMNTDNDDGIPLRPVGGLEKILLFAAAENKIDITKIKNSRTIQTQLQILRQREKEEFRRSCCFCLILT